MKKTILKSMAFALAGSLLSYGAANATIMDSTTSPALYDGNVTELTNGAYSTPDDWGINSENMPTGGLDHYSYYTWSLSDNILEGGAINIVFHDIYNYVAEPNTLEVIIFNEPSSGPLPDGLNLAGNDDELLSPDWSSLYGQTVYSIGVWTDDDGPAWPYRDYPAGTTNDVVFSITAGDIGEANWSSLMNDTNNTFVLGIDPDCHYATSEITVETPVPEPATMLLFGTGLVGLAGISKRRKKKA